MQQKAFSVLFFLGILLTGLATKGQEINRCATVDMVAERDQLFPGYLQAVNETYERLKDFSKSKRFSGGEGEVLRIPVVVHVVYNNADQNLSDSIIFSQIERLNLDFRRQNSDTNATRAVFDSVAADTGIEFYLADKDPDGNPTTGIVRVSTTQSFGSLLPAQMDRVKQTSQGGSDAWRPSCYLNIWVCDLSFFGIPLVMGYAYPPADMSNWPPNSEAPDTTLEGVVVHFPAFGVNNPFATGPLSVVNQGRTTVHEVGHYLGLRHVWGDGPCNEDDGLTDTPFAANASQQECNLNKNTCLDTPYDFPDMIENYMDYSDEVCMNMFTRQQGALMRATLQTVRSGLGECNKDTITPPDTTNIGIAVGSVLVGNVVIAPNPARGVVNVSFTAPASETVYLSLRDLSGKTVIRQKATATGPLRRTQLQVSGLPSGMYFLNLEPQSGLPSTHKIFIE